MKGLLYPALTVIYKIKRRNTNKYYDNIVPLSTPSAPESFKYDTAQKLKDAWNINGQSQNLGWHRDHIYYGVNPNNPNGPFMNNYRERMTTFKLKASSPLNALNNISSASTVDNVYNNLADPQLIAIAFQQGGTFTAANFWTDGKFDFNVYIYHNPKNGSS
jgi:hypothetical protein